MAKLLFNILTALLTLLLGICVQNIFQSKQMQVSTTSIETSEIALDSISQSENTQTVKAQELGELEAENFFSGWYSVDNFKGIKGVWTILLSKDNDGNDEKLVWSAIVLTENENDDFHSILINTDDNNLYFKTNNFRGVEYKFEGKFFKERKLGFEGEKLLRGTFQKLVKGKKVAEIKADFAYNEPHCWH